ncbi:uncharacterized protein LOC119406597 [Rhipicephalus sanguineus]|uniref:uncharacterized protein LOC119406597 n=1 Tax=Rhipicephalus sanguineus TaxID=34632 RepID=UPI0020C2D1D2|nr:uncharacterized protein LOC119406597 [Rhipicephalus sanguineus]
MQVSVPQSLFTKKSSNYFLLQLPSPRCCCTTVVECVRAVRLLLLLVSGDIESNPGPDAVLAELQKLSAGQSTLLNEVQGLKSQLLTTEHAQSDLAKRIADMEKHYQALLPLKAELELIKKNSVQAARKTVDLEARLDDAENRSRLNNLIFYGVPDANPSESYAQSEQLIIRHCHDHLGIDINPKDIDRVHRLGRHSGSRCRPIIAKFTFYKTKQEILSNGRKLRGTTYSIGEDFSRRVQNARRQLVEFARQKSSPFSLRYKTLHIGSKRYSFNETTKTVQEIQ